MAAIIPDPKKNVAGVPTITHAPTLDVALCHAPYAPIRSRRITAKARPKAGR